MRWNLLLFAAAISFAQERTPFDFAPSLPEQIAALSDAQDHLIGDLVSPLSGQPCRQVVDLTVKGAQPISLHRSYIAPMVVPPPGGRDKLVF